MSLVPCPGSAQPPAATYHAPGTVDEYLDAGLEVCSRCGTWRRLRADGRIGKHPVAEGAIVPMIRRPLAARRRA